jgi:hypothetical protein
VLGAYWDTEDNTGLYDFKTLGVYNYVSQNPVNNFDPDGEVNQLGTIPHKAGIYILTNKTTGRAYVGSGVDVRRRLQSSAHLSAQSLISKKSTKIRFVRVKIGGATGRNVGKVLRRFEMKHYRRIEKTGKYIMINKQRPENPRKKVPNQTAVNNAGASAKARVVARAAQ